MIQQKSGGFDRNSIIGLVVIVLIVIGFSIYNKPSKKDIADKRTEDSIKYLQARETEDSVRSAIAAISAKGESNKDKIESKVNVKNADSVKQKQQKEFGGFAASLSGNNDTITLENDVIKASISSKGGRVTTVVLKKYKTFELKPLVLFHEQNSNFNLSFPLPGKAVESKDLYFQANKKSVLVTNGNSDSISLRVNVGEGQYIEYVYKIKAGSYMVDFKLNLVGMNNVLAQNRTDIEGKWQQTTPRQEKSYFNENAATAIYYSYIADNETDNLSETKDKEEEFKDQKIRWVSYKQQFFSTIFIAPKGISDVKVKSKLIETPALQEKFVKTFSTDFLFNIAGKNKEHFDFQFYFGPNHYKTLKSYDINLEREIPLGWGFAPIAWVNRFLVIPVFNFLDSFNLGYGLIILLLTLFIKLLLFPIAYKTFVSSAKMKVLKPEVDEIGKKFSKSDEAMKKQQATMAMYKKAGVNPMAGCLPLLLQMPILYALFRFFPASIELRQQGFLWATDLSTYDEIFRWTTDIPLLSSFYGNHISLFTIFMTISMYVYTYTNSQMMTGSSQQMPGMKTMMYIMPIFFMGFMNKYAAGLSYYYFLANMVTFLQQLVIKRYFVDEAKILQKIRFHQSKKEAPKKSKFKLRLEEMAKQKGYNAKR